jgi:hypothetical protein
MIKTTTFYDSANGDRWQLLQNDETGQHRVRHEPNLASGGRPTDTPLPEFLSRTGATPQGEALRALLDKCGIADPEEEN